MKHLTKKGLVVCALAALALSGCKSKEEPDDPNRKNNSKVETLDHLIIQEIFHAGNWHPRGYYTKDDTYIKIHNPTNKTMYLDGMALLMTPFSSNRQLELSKDCDFRETHVAVDKLVQFPGKGQEYPVEPGKAVLVAHTAVDYTKDGDDGTAANPNSFDLSIADFEWLTKEQIEEDDRKDNTKVPNLSVIYVGDTFFDQRAAGFAIHSGTGLLALVKLGVPAKDLEKEEYKWECTWNQASGGHSHGGNGTYLKIPNAWIVDAVNLCPKEGFKWYIVSRTIDAGWTSAMSHRPSRRKPHGLALVRKHDGKNFVDTNNSTVDFEIVEPSLRMKK
ncbi:MAG: DUF4876 domain-containing protein [Porphyromonadaceae bacterium]|nr:DUF4876 domain-containing protein [Porphyromonadaceae bacterium]